MIFKIIHYLHYFMIIVFSSWKLGVRVTRFHDNLKEICRSTTLFYSKQFLYIVAFPGAVNALTQQLYSIPVFTERVENTSDVDVLLGFVVKTLYGRFNYVMSFADTLTSICIS